jgi:hypothetical protein
MYFILKKCFNFANATHVKFPLDLWTTHMQKWVRSWIVFSNREKVSPIVAKKILV